VNVLLLIDQAIVGIAGWAVPMCCGWGMALEAHCSFLLSRCSHPVPKLLHWAKPWLCRNPQWAVRHQ